jgi:hypothetical protein
MGSTKIFWAQTGPQGPQGAKGLNFRGASSSTVAYAVGDVVTFNGSSWYAKVANTNSQPPSTNWALLAAKGAQGAQGAQGHQGAQGAQGAKGAQGAAGAQGAQGAVGAQGAQGAKGAQGAVGAQGPQGAQGATDPPGALSGYYHYATGAVAKLPASGKKVIVGVLTPNSSGAYAVTATVDVALNHKNALGTGAACWLASSFSNSRSHSSDRSRTPLAVTFDPAASRIVALTNTGDISVEPRRSGRLVEYCALTAGADSDSATSVQMTATRLSTKIGQAVARQPQQRFIPRGRAAVKPSSRLKH